MYGIRGWRSTERMKRSHGSPARRSMPIRRRVRGLSRKREGESQRELRDAPSMCAAFGRMRYACPGEPGSNLRGIRRARLGAPGSNLARLSGIAWGQSARFCARSAQNLRTICEVLRAICARSARDFGLSSRFLRTFAQTFAQTPCRHLGIPRRRHAVQVCAETPFYFHEHVCELAR